MAGTLSGKNPSLTPRNVARPLGLICHGALVSVIGSYLSIWLQHSLNDAIRGQALRGKVTKRWWHTSRVRIPDDIMMDICLVRMFLAPDGHSRVWTRPIGLLILRSPTIRPISDACYGGLGGWAQGHPLIWRLNKADLEACGFILPTGREPSEAEKKEMDFDHINMFVAVIVNIWVAVRYLMLQPRRTVHVIMNVLSDNMQHELKRNQFVDWHVFSRPFSHIAVYCTSNKGTYTFLRSYNVITRMQAVCRLAHPDKDSFFYKNAALMVSHSNRVTAAVALQNAGLSIDAIAFCLRWSPESVKHYLRDCSHAVGELTLQAVKGALLIRC